MTELDVATPVVDVYEAIKQAIVSEAYTSGDYLREEQLARSLGVSRTPVREAFRRLGSEGWLEVKPNFGVRVKTWSIRDVEEIFEARILIEAYLVGRAASQIGADDLATIKGLAQEMLVIAQSGHAVASLDAWFVANRAFHDILTAAAGNARLDQSLRMMKEVPLIRWTFNNYSQEDRERSARQHIEIVEALENRDGEWAEAIVKCHILAAQTTVIRKLRSKG